MMIHKEINFEFYGKKVNVKLKIKNKSFKGDWEGKIIICSLDMEIEVGGNGWMLKNALYEISEINDFIGEDCTLYYLTSWEIDGVRYIDFRPNEDDRG